MESIIVIPSRYGSTRFPGKPLSMIAGRSLIQRVYAIAKSVGGVDEVIVATDDERIEKHVASFGGRAVMTSPDCDNGTERVFDLLKRLKLKPKVAVNFQGDAVLTPPSVLETLVRAMKSDPSATFATPAVQLTELQYDELLQSKSKIPSGTLVTFDRNFNALYKLVS